MVGDADEAVLAEVVLEHPARLADQIPHRHETHAAIGGGARFIDHNNVMQAARRAPDSTRLAQFAERAGEVLFIDQIPFHSMKLIG